MTKIINKIKSYHNWIGKCLLVFVGLMMAIGLGWSIMVKGFLLTDKELPFTSVQYIIYFTIAATFIVGGYQLNKFISVGRELIKKLTHNN